jgi:integrase/recombinase XerD
MSMDFQTALEGYWLARRRDFSIHTIDDYERTFKRFLTYIGSRPVAEITPQDIHKFLDKTKTKYKLGNKTMANIWTALSSFWTWAEDELRIAHPMRGVVKLPEYKRPPIEPYTKSEVMAMLAATQQTATWRTRNGRKATSKRPTALRDYTIIVVLLDTGIRAAELCDLQVRDYESGTGKISIKHGKGDKKRIVYIGQSGRKYLWRYLVNREGAKSTDPLFITRRGTAIARDELLNMITATAARAAVSHANVHKFRHTFAINFLRNGGNVLELQRLLGHEKMDTLLIYVQLANSDLAAAQAQASPADNWGL